MIELIMQNVTMISWFLIILGLGFLSNILSAIYVNVFTLGQNWDTKKFICGVIKAIIFCLSFYVFTIGATIIPTVLSQYGIMSEEIGEVVNLAVIAGILITASVNEYKKTVENWKITLNNKKEALDGD